MNGSVLLILIYRLLFVSINNHFTNLIIQMRSDSSHDLSFRRESDTLSALPKHLSLENFRHSTGGESPKDTSVLPNKPTGPFGLCTYKQKIWLLTNIQGL